MAAIYKCIDRERERLRTLISTLRYTTSTGEAGAEDGQAHLGGRGARGARP